MNQVDRIEYIAGRVKCAAALEQLGEEAAELCHAALKYARIIRGENPTPKTPEEAQKALAEEMADVILCARVLMAQGITFENKTIGDKKARRWVDRLREEAGENGKNDLPL